MMRYKGLFFIIVFTAIIIFPGLVISIDATSLSGKSGKMAVDNRIYEDLLEKYVKDGFVNYRGMKNEEDRLDQYLKILEGVDPSGLSKDDVFAYYVNAYNAWTIKLILSAYPGIESIKELGILNRGPWKKKIVRLKSGLMSLDNIEHDILRAQFKDPRVHFAVNCASKGCPALRSEPFEGSVLDRQLNEMTEAFINNPGKNRLEGRVLYVSKIFKWFKEDFDKDVIGFFKRYAKGDLKKRIPEDEDKIKVKYLNYDWSLNGV